MAWLVAIGREAYGLFVDDAPFAMAILAWVVALGFAAPRLPGVTAGILLFAGLAAILLVSTRRRARR